MFDKDELYFVTKDANLFLLSFYLNPKYFRESKRKKQNAACVQLQHILCLKCNRMFLVFGVNVLINKK